MLAAIAAISLATAGTPQLPNPAPLQHRNAEFGFVKRQSSIVNPALLSSLILHPSSFNQGYSPRPGETVLRMDVEGKGSVFILLYTRQAPRASGQIAGLARKGFYDGQRFFEVIKSPRPYLVRFGDPQSRNASALNSPAIGTGGTGARIPHEDSGFRHEKGAVGLAHPQDDRNAGDCQFYIMLGAAGFLDGSYTVFGKVVSGMDVVEKVDRGDVVVSVKVLGG